MEHYVGLDVSLKQTSICVVNQVGSVVREGVVESEPEAIAAFVRSKAPGAVRIGLETGPTATWLWTELKRLGLPVICIDARHAKDVLKDPDYAHRSQAKTLNYRSIAAVPMLKDGCPLGTIAMARSQTGMFPEWQIDLLRTFAAQAVIAIENVRLFDEIQDKNRQLQLASENKAACCAPASIRYRKAP
jgi:GAF domain-containing protein